MWPSFIVMDEPDHAPQRKTVAPLFTPTHLDKLAEAIRERSAETLDTLPRNEIFDFVDRVSVELTTQMLAVLFDFPWEERRKLTRWSDLATALPKSGVFESEDERRAELKQCGEYFAKLFAERARSEPKSDLVSMMAHSPATREMSRANLMGNIIILIVGGNDTTRNSMTASVLALDGDRKAYQRLRETPALLDSFVPEVIRWQTPIAHMRRTATRDTDLGGKTIRKGDKVVMWYVSGNRDSEVIEDPDSFIIDRPRARNHLSFGFGVHRCVGLRLAELQLRIVWEEILKRFDAIEVAGEPSRVYSSFVRGYDKLPVRIPG
jgi:cytochrome P450